MWSHSMVLYCVTLSFAFVVDVVAELAWDGVLGEMLHADHLVMMSKVMEGL